jgi:P2 family phage contractile tail tube protein
MLKDVMRDVAAFVDGRNYAGQCRQVNLPELTIQTEEFRAGGMDAPLEMDMGMGAMRASLQFLTVPVDVMKQLGKDNIDLTLRGALKSFDGTVKGATARLRGKFIGQNPGDWQPGSSSTFTATFAASYYQLTVAGEVIHEIDIERSVRIIDGKDQLADIRNALGL